MHQFRKWIYYIYESRNNYNLEKIRKEYNLGQNCPYLRYELSLIKDWRADVTEKDKKQLIRSRDCAEEIE